MNRSESNYAAYYTARGCAIGFALGAVVTFLLSAQIETMRQPAWFELALAAVCALISIASKESTNA